MADGTMRHVIAATGRKPVHVFAVSTAKKEKGQRRSRSCAAWVNKWAMLSLTRRVTMMPNAAVERRDAAGSGFPAGAEEQSDEEPLALYMSPSAPTAC
jgi:hypothetical protein